MMVIVYEWSKVDGSKERHEVPAACVTADELICNQEWASTEEAQRLGYIGFEIVDYKEA